MQELKYEELTASEKVWRDHQPWLLKCGYKLRARYDPNWIPSWRGTGKDALDFEDSTIQCEEFMDAVRVSDGVTVALYLIQSAPKNKIAVWRYFSTDSVREDPNNHCVPLYAQLKSPVIKGALIFITPLLKEFDNPELRTVGEAVDFFRQIFQGLCFMHDNNIAHRNIVSKSLQMDASPIYLKPYHPQLSIETLDFQGIAHPVTRTEKPVRYYITDFSKSVWGKPLGQADPFAYDVAMFGEFMKRHFIERNKKVDPFQGLDFLRPLVDSMVQTNAENRPTMHEASRRFSEVVRSLGSWRLQTRLRASDEGIIDQPFSWFGHYKRQFVTGVSAVLDQVSVRDSHA